MPQREYIPRDYKLAPTSERASDTFVSLRSQGSPTPFSFTFDSIHPTLFRITFTSETHPLPPHPSVSPPQKNLQGLKPAVEFSESQRRIILDDLEVTVKWADTPIVSLSWSNSETPLHKDLPFRSYAADADGIARYACYNAEELHVGLGEKAAPMNLSNRHFILSATDCFGYDVYRTDPMYKHIPLLINTSPEGCVGMFSTSLSRGTWSVGSEMDGLWGRYKVYRQDYGGLEEYLIVGHTLKDVVRTYADLVGYPRLVPRWAFGYIAGGMKYSMLDEPRACDALVTFADKLKEHHIPCSAFQMSSGYTVAETEPKTRNVFTWNRHRFPDPAGFAKDYHDRGIRLIANVKPYVLTNHPEYQKLVDDGALFRHSATEANAVTRLWSAGGGESGEGGHIDFTSSAGFAWWYNGVKELRKVGIDSIWNDNNEYTISSDEWQCALDDKCVNITRGPEGRNQVGLWGRSLQTELMAKSSHDALVELEPHRRPFVLTRSATAGTMRYAASSWSGDNVTSWSGMKGANALSLNAGMTLLQCYGHDIGGFEGPQPSPELLLRWIQLGIHSSRFAINCYKTSPEDNSIGHVIEPWMYPEITSLVRDAIKRRYELMPYIYSLALESHLTASPPQRWVGWGYEVDPEVWSDHLKGGETQYWLGDSLLVGGVYEPGVEVARMYLPKREDDEDGFINLNEPCQHLEAGQWVNIESPWRRSIPVLAKIGGAVPVGLPFQTLSTGEDKKSWPNMPIDDYRGVEIFPPRGDSKGRVYHNTWYEDDGITSKDNTSKFMLSYTATTTEVVMNFERASGGKYEPDWKSLHIIMPIGDERNVMYGKDKKDAISSGLRRGRKTYRLG